MRAFIAVPVSEEVKAKIEPFRKQLGAISGIKAIEPENLHITLFFLGEIGEERKNEVVSAMERISTPKFQLNFSGAGAFPNPNFIRVLWVGCEDENLAKLYSELATSVSRMGYALEDFRAHLTVARVKDPAGKPGAQEALGKFKDSDFGSCLIDRVALFKSTLTPDGPVYEEVYEKKLVSNP